MGLRPKSHWGAYSAPTPRRHSWWEEGWLSLPKNPIPALGLLGLGFGLSKFQTP